MTGSIKKSNASLTNKKAWGLLPVDVHALILKREWENISNLKARLLGSKPFPIKIGLKPPVGKQAVEDLPHFQSFIENWKSCPNHMFIEWETRSFRTLLEQRIPKFVILNSIQDLITFVGNEARLKCETWEANMAPLLRLSGGNVYSVLVKHLQAIESMPFDDCRLLKSLVEQLSEKMGAGLYLRALPLLGVDTKFLENYQKLISDLLDAIYGNAVSQAGGLLAWLGCLENPKGWLCIRPLCAKTRVKMAGLPILQLPVNVLKSYELPARNILIVENMQSGLGLPELENTITVFGGGKNIAWMEAQWLKDKRVAYWGDIDTWGLAILSDVRAKLPNVTPLMMDIKTIKLFEDRMVVEPDAVEVCPEHLNESEVNIFSDLKSCRYHSSRLEQERLSADYILGKIEKWLQCKE